jgi:adenosylmethionine-8-amino-7-oxononanoate aminotransferase
VQSSISHPDEHSRLKLRTHASPALWGHFTRLSAGPAPIISRGEGVYIWDAAGHRLLDGLSGLFCVQVGHGRRELAEAAARQMEQLAFFPIWSYATEPASALAERLVELSPPGLSKVFFTDSGSAAVESAWKLARQYFKLKGEPLRTKVVSRMYTYHGTSMGALSISGVPSIKTPFEPLVPGAVKIANTNRYRCHDCSHLDACTLRCADDLELRIEMEGPESVAAVFLEPVQNTGGALVPPAGYFARIREICDRYGILLVSDEVICAFGRFGYWFGSERFGYRPDMITFAKGVTSGYASLGGVLVADHVAEPFTRGDEVFLHGMTYGGHPTACAVALANIDIIEREDLNGNVLGNEALFDTLLDGLRDIPIVGDVRGAGYFRCIELVADQATKQTLTAEQCETILRTVLSPRLYELGLYCRADDRADPVLVISPPLICGPDHLHSITGILRTALSEASALL